MSPVWCRKNGGILINFVECFQIKTSTHSIYDLKELTITELWPLHTRRMNYLGHRTSLFWHRENRGILIDQRKISLNFVKCFQIKTSYQLIYDLKELTSQNYSSHKYMNRSKMPPVWCREYCGILIDQRKFSLNFVVF